MEQRREEHLTAALLLRGAAYLPLPAPLLPRAAMNTAMATTSLSLQGRPYHAPTRKLSSPVLGAPASFLRPLAPAPAAGPSSRRTLAVRAMAPPKPGGKAKKGPCPLSRPASSAFLPHQG
jgi:hypothetical protein